MYCKKCGHKQATGEKFCPVCGSPFESTSYKESVPMGENESEVGETVLDNEEQPEGSEILILTQYCKKCGTKQEPGQKFCPVCGEPYLDESGIAYTKGMKKKILETKDDGLLSTVDSLSVKGKDASKVIGDKLKDVSGNVKDNVVKTKVKDFFSNVVKMKRWGKIIAVLVAVFFFIFKAGFHASWMWLVCLIAMLALAFCPDKYIRSAKKQFVGVVLLGITILLVGPGNERSSYDDDSLVHSEENSAEGQSDDGYQADVDKLQEEINAQSEVVQQLVPAYEAVLQQVDGSLVIAQQTNPSICEKFRDEVNKYEDLCSKAASICDRNGDKEQAQYYRSLEHNLEQSVAQMEGRP